MVMFSGRRQCRYMVTVFVLVQVSVIILYAFHGNQMTVHRKQLEAPRLPTHAHNTQGQGIRTDRGILSYQGDGIQIIRDTDSNSLTIEGKELHLHIHSGKVVLHSSSHELSDESLIRVPQRHPTLPSQKPKALSSKKTNKNRSINIRNDNLMNTNKSYSVLQKGTKNNLSFPRKDTKNIHKRSLPASVTKVNKPSPKVLSSQVNIIGYKGSKVSLSNVQVKAVKIQTVVTKRDYQYIKPKLSSRTTTAKNDVEINKFVSQYLKDCEENKLNITYKFLGSVKKLCPCLPDGLGRVAVNPTLPATKVASNPKEYDTRAKGVWRPATCTARQRVVVIVPYRDRAEHLALFLSHMHRYLQKQLLAYSILVVEQVEPAVFNRAALMNIGFMEAGRLGDYDCFVFHDVDLLPEDTRNMYTCTTSPRHVAVAVDKFRYMLQYSTIVGGALAMTRDQMITVNGFSNKFYGWGGEDDDMYNRIRAKHYNVARYPETIGRYTMLQHWGDSGNPPNPTGAVGLEMRPEEYEVDGLNSLTHEVTKQQFKELYTLVQVKIKQ